MYKNMSRVQRFLNSCACYRYACKCRYYKLSGVSKITKSKQFLYYQNEGEYDHVFNNPILGASKNKLTVHYLKTRCSYVKLL